MNLAARRLRVCRHALDAALVAHVQSKRHRLPPNCFYLGYKFGEVVAAPAGENQVGSGLRQRTRKDLPKAAAGSGNEGGLPAEIEEGIR
jgi:hypothetical protein